MVQGMCMAMSMTGFSTVSDGRCINFLTKGLPINSAVGMAAAALVTIAMGIAVEYLGLLSSQWRTKMSKMATYQTPRAKTVYMGLYMIERFGAYIAMLVAMSYSAELLVALIVGLAAGHAIFVLPQIEKGAEGQSLFEKPPCC